MSNGRKRLMVVAACSCVLVTAAWMLRRQRKKMQKTGRGYSDGAKRGKPRMIVADPDRFAAKWRRFCADGLDRLLVISDFDQTATPQFLPSGAQATSSHGLLMANVLADPEMRRREQALFHQYYPIEVSPKLTQEQKLPHMIDWWNKAHDLLIEVKLQQKQIEEAAALKMLPFRPGFTSFMATLEQHDVPILLFSAGLYQVIHAMLDKEYHDQGREFTPSNIHVVSNMMRFDEDGVLEGFEGDLIHCYNKNASVLVDTPFWKRCKLEKRSNVLLLGDSRGDAEMAEGLDIDDDSIIRVGFLNLHVDEALNEYLDLYDVVLTHDASFDAIETMLPPPSSASPTPSSSSS